MYTINVSKTTKQQHYFSRDDAFVSPKIIILEQTVQIKCVTFFCSLLYYYAIL